MAFVQECLQKLVELFYLTEERKAEKFLAHSLSNPKKINQNLKRVFSNKYFRIFKKSVSSNGLEISISKKYFKLAVDRNTSKRRIKEIVRQNGLGDVLVVIMFFLYLGPLQSYHICRQRQKLPQQ